MASTRSSSRRRPEPTPIAPAVDVYLFPAVVGGGRGDIEEVLTLGRRLAGTGAPVFLYRARGRALPRGVAEPFDWPPHARVAEPVGGSARALTVATQFGTTAESERPGPLGHPGPWAYEREEVERRYGPGAVLHVSVEEFARARPLRWLAEERWREGGLAAAEIARRRPSRAAQRDRARFRRLYRRFRSFDRSDLLSLFPGFLPSRAFEREFPESVQCGPIAPWPRPPVSRPSPPHRSLQVLWYASPASSDRIASLVVEGLERMGRRTTLILRAPHAPAVEGTPHVRIAREPPIRPVAWESRWSSGDLAITTGSRTLLEALARGVPFLYFNGLLETGRRTRRHRPEKLVELVRWLALDGVPDRVRADLLDFGRGRAVAEVVARAATDPQWRSAFRPRQPGRAYAPGFEEAGALVVSVARRWADPSTERSSLLKELRAASRRRRGVSKV